MSAAASVIQRPIQTRTSLERQLVAAAEREHRLRLAEITQMHRLLSRFDRFVAPLAELGFPLGDRRVFAWDAKTLMIAPAYAEARDDALYRALRVLGFDEVGRADCSDGRCWARLEIGGGLAVRVAVSLAPKGGAA